MLVNRTSAQMGMIAAEGLILLVGLCLLGWVQFTRSGGRFRVSRLPGWSLSLGAFGFAIAQVIGGGLLGIVLSRVLSSSLPHSISNDATFSTVIINGGLHLGVLAGVVWAYYSSRNAAEADESPAVAAPDQPRLKPGHAVLAGLLTFCGTVLLLIPVGFVWDSLLELLGVPLQKQELIEIFAKADTPAKLLVMSLIAIVIAPMTEELTFRAGLFRFFRGRIPRWMTYTVPAALFAGLHNNLAVFAPLLVLGVVFSFAYERTGRIAVPIIAHALFNLNTILLIVVMGVNV